MWYTTVYYAVQGGSNFKVQAPVVQRVDNAIHWINHYLADKC